MKRIISLKGIPAGPASKYSVNGIIVGSKIKTLLPKACSSDDRPFYVRMDKQRIDLDLNDISFLDCILCNIDSHVGHADPANHRILLAVDPDAKDRIGFDPLENVSDYVADRKIHGALLYQADSAAGPDPDNGKETLAF